MPLEKLGATACCRAGRLRHAWQLNKSAADEQANLPVVRIVPISFQQPAEAAFGNCIYNSKAFLFDPL
jgi:hypothetical protein